jgi:hypothetical protein
MAIHHPPPALDLVPIVPRRLLVLCHAPLYKPFHTALVASASASSSASAMSRMHRHRCCTGPLTIHFLPLGTGANDFWLPMSPSLLNETLSSFLSIGRTSSSFLDSDLHHSGSRQTAMSHNAPQRSLRLGGIGFPASDGDEAGSLFAVNGRALSGTQESKEKTQKARQSKVIVVIDAGESRASSSAYRPVVPHELTSSNLLSF